MIIRLFSSYTRSDITTTLSLLRKSVRIQKMQAPLPGQERSDTAEQTKRPLEEEEGSVRAEPIKRVKTQTEGTAGNTPDIKPVSEGSTSKRKEEGTSKSMKKDKRREKSKGGRRDRRGTREEGASQLLPANGESRGPRLPKRACALLIGFRGSAYRGMQFQKSVEGQPPQGTIEGALFSALVKAGAISQDNADDPSKVALTRAARTDKGVHAAGNIVSLKMIMNIPGETKSMLERINEELPEDIRLWDFVRVQNSFNARTDCDSRKYVYLFPSYMLIPPKSDDHPFWSSSSSDTPEEDLTRKRQWRATAEDLSTLRQIALKFLGSHNFHNFTVTKDAKQASNYRFIKSVEVQDPAVYGGTEWIAVKMHGQSFMLHQIRKMMFILVMMCRTKTSLELVYKLYSDQISVSIPKMPALGLLLEHPIYDSYNAKVAAQTQGIEASSPEYRPPVLFDAHVEKMEVFKQKYIYDDMREVEDRKGVFDAWLRSVDAYTGDDLKYLNKEGLIPDVCIHEKGKPRTSGFRDSVQFDRTSFSVDDNTKMAVAVGVADDLAEVEGEEAIED